MASTECSSGHWPRRLPRGSAGARLAWIDPGEREVGLHIRRVWRLRLGHQHHLVEEGLAIAGEVDIATVSQLRDRLTAALAHRPTRFGLDLSGVTFADSQLVHVLLQARAMIPGGRLVVSGCQPQVARLLGVCGLAGLIAPRHDACAPEAPTEDPPAVRSFAA